MNDERVTLVLPARPSYLSLARLIISNVASTTPTLQESRLADLRLIVSEVFTNAMKANWKVTEARLAESGERPTHDEVLDASEPVTFSCRVGFHEIELVVTDRGAGFDNVDDPHPPQYDPERLQHEHGLGVPLIQFLSDEVDYTSGPEGTSVRILVLDTRGGEPEG